MADLDEISAGIGGLQADMRRAIQWFDQHEAADQRRFEQLAARIDAVASQHGTRVSALEMQRAELVGGWKILSLIGTVAGGVGAFIYHLMGVR
jgi:hypothetical protein